MNTTLHRFAMVVLLLSGLLGAIPPSVDAASAGIEVQHRDFMLGLLGATLVLSVFVPWLRLPAIGASVLSKLAFIAVAAATAFGGGPVPSQVWLEVLLTASLVGAGIVFLREAWQEARWNGMLPVRLES